MPLPDSQRAMAPVFDIDNLLQGISYKTIYSPCFAYSVSGITQNLLRLKDADTLDEALEILRQGPV